MTDEALDEALAGVPQPGGAGVDEITLLRYRNGEMDEVEMAAVEAALAGDPESRALLAGLAQPIDEAQWSRAAAALPKRPSRAWMALPLAAAAGLLLFLAMPSGQSLPEYGVEGPFGGRKVVRSDRETLVFGPESTLEVGLRPVAPTATPKLGIYTGDPLRALPSEGVRAGKDGAFRCRLPMGAALGEAYGTHTLHFVVGDPGGLAGLSESEARARAQAARWLSVQVEYRGGD